MKSVNNNRRERVVSDIVFNKSFNPCLKITPTCLRWSVHWKREWN